MRGEMEDEEKRLDIMMEVDRQNAIKIQEEIEKKRKEERLLGRSRSLRPCMPISYFSEHLEIHCSGFVLHLDHMFDKQSFECF